MMMMVGLRWGLVGVVEDIAAWMQRVREISWVDGGGGVEREDADGAVEVVVLVFFGGLFFGAGRVWWCGCGSRRDGYGGHRDSDANRIMMRPGG